MALRLVQIAMNARDDSAVGPFWAEALGWRISSEEPGVTSVEPQGFGATLADLGQGDVPWTCLADPEGNEFDVLTPR
jgi:predicted enzyme related to lactoylglutathione lyase